MVHSRLHVHPVYQWSMCAVPLTFDFVWVFCILNGWSKEICSKFIEVNLFTRVYM